MIRDRIAQQIEHPSDGCIVEREFVAVSERFQEFFSGRPAPRIQMERHEVIDQSRESDAAKNAFEPNRSTDERADPFTQLRRMAQLSEPGQQQLRIVCLSFRAQHSRDENRQLVDNDQQIAARTRQPGEPRLELIRGVAPLATNCALEFDAQHAGIDGGGQSPENVLDCLRKRDCLETASKLRTRRQGREERRYAVRRAVAALDIDVDDIPVLVRCAVELQHQAGLAHAPGREHQKVLALIQPFPDSSQLVVSSVEIVADDGLTGDVSHSRSFGCGFRERRG